MAKSRETYSKKENEKKRIKKREDKARRKEERKANSAGGGLDNMMAYVDEYGNLSSTPQDTALRPKVIAEDIVLGAAKRDASPPANELRKGIVTMFNESKGYGFIRDAETGQSIFTHVNDHAEAIRENDRVTFKIVQGHKGPGAIEVKLDR